MTQMTRKEAIAAGTRHYMGGPCKYGHHVLRFTSTGKCTACATQFSASAEKKAYDQERYGRLRPVLLAEYKERYLGQRDARIQSAREWSQRNPEARRAISNSYKHRRRSKEGDGISYSEFEGWKKSVRKTCFWCGIDCADRFEVDHFFPLSGDGKHEIENLVIACRPCNARKSSKSPERFLAEIEAGLIPHIKWDKQ